MLILLTIKNKVSCIYYKILSSEMSDAKVVIIGSSGVGKTSLAIRFTHDQFNDYL